MSGFISSSVFLACHTSQLFGQRLITHTKASKVFTTRRAFRLKATIAPSTDTKPYHESIKDESQDDVNLSEKREPEKKPNPIPEDAVPYFAYFANMNPNKIGPRAQLPLRRCKIYHSEPTFLPRYEIAFDVPGIPPEPVFANLVQSQDEKSGIYGVVHWISPKDFERLSLSEGVLSSTSPLNFIPRPLRIGANVIDVEVFTQSPTKGESEIRKVIAKTIQFPNDRLPTLVKSMLRPSRRYVQVAIDGAEYWGINKSYVDNVLRSIKYEKGVLGGFGLFTESRPHILDRPNPNNEFGRSIDEIYSPWKPIQAKSAVKKFHNDEEDNSINTKLRMIHVSTLRKEKTKQRTPLIFLPGIDGTGKGVVGQVTELEKEGYYDVSSIVYPYANRQSITGLAETIIEIIREEFNDRPVCIVGESMGGAVALELAMQNTRRRMEQEGKIWLNIESLVMINPASSYERSAPRVLWETILDLGLSEEWYNILLPPVLLPFVVDMENAVQSVGPESIARLRNMLFSLADIAKVLPQSAMTHRVNLLRDIKFSSEDLAILNSPLSPEKMGVICTINDNLIPSFSEKQRLQRLIPNIYSIVLPYGGHVPMLDPQFSLSGLLRPFHRNPDSSNTIPSSTSSERVLSRRKSIKKRHGSDSEDPKASKPFKDIRRLATRLMKSRKELAPVFIGEENIPEFDPEKPVIFISNHTLQGWYDGMYPVLKVLESRNILIHALAHPVLIQTGGFFPGMDKVTAQDFDEFGVRIVSPRTLLECFADGKWSMLFPGGAREALKQSSDEKYSVMWPQQPEFIRQCALFNATIIPISTIGTEDMVRIIADSTVIENVLKAYAALTNQAVPFSEFTTDMVKQWRGESENNTSVLPPIMIPDGNDRLYYRFGKPIHIPEECLNDPELERKMYAKVKSKVEEGVEILKRRREYDMFRPLEKRKKFTEKFGEFVHPPAGPAWGWETGTGSYLDDHLQPPM